MSSIYSKSKPPQLFTEGKGAVIVSLFRRAVDPYSPQTELEISKPPFDTLNPPEICNVPTSSYAERRYNILFSAGEEEDPELEGRFILGMN